MSLYNYGIKPKTAKNREVDFCYVVMSGKRKLSSHQQLKLAIIQADRFAETCADITVVHIPSNTVMYNKTTGEKK